MKKRKAHKKAGRQWINKPLAQPAGTFINNPDALSTNIKVITYNQDDFLEYDSVKISQISELIANWSYIWIDLYGLADTAAIHKIGEIFSFHQLPLADVVNVPQRPKIEEYENYFFNVMRVVHKQDEMESDQISLFFGKNFVVTFHEKPSDIFAPVRERLLKGRSHMRSGADYLAYALLDAVIDSFYPLLEAFDEQLEMIEDQVIDTRLKDISGDVHQLRKNIIVTRRAILPLREEINNMLNIDEDLVKPETQVHLRDCLDHASQIVDRLDSYRELTAGLMDMHLSAVSNRMNDVMKVLTLIATIFIPLSFIAGVYGMNFNPDVSPWNMPETHWIYGYPFALGLMAVVAGGLLIFFKRRGWLGSANKAEKKEDQKKTQ